jgi:hypothetical protein
MGAVLAALAPIEGRGFTCSFEGHFQLLLIHL